MEDPYKHALVVKAFALAKGTRGYVSGYVEWCDERTVALARSNLADLSGLTPEAVREMAIDHVNGGGAITQVRETRTDRPDYRFYYKVILAIPDFPRGVFVEHRLVDDDPEDPVVHIVSAHRQGV
jgi:hypothetical protein